MSLTSKGGNTLDLYWFEQLCLCSFFSQVQMEVDVWFVQDSLRGDETTEIRLKFIRKLEDALPAGED